ncbi:MAG: glycoside hydrolase domain-containing protein [Lentisphaeria bacterium]
MIVLKYLLFFTFISSFAFSTQAFEIKFDSETNAGKFFSGWCSNIAKREIKDKTLYGFITSSDPKLVSETINIRREEVNFIVVDMAVEFSNTWCRCQFFITSDVKGVDVYAEASLQPDGKMHRYVIDLRQAKKYDKINFIKSFRFDPLDPGNEGDSFHLKGIYLVKTLDKLPPPPVNTQAATTSFEMASITQARSFYKKNTSGIAERVIKDGVLTAKITNRDPYFSTVPLGVDRKDLDSVFLEMSVEPGSPTSAQIFFNLGVKTEPGTYMFIPIIADGEMHQYTRKLVGTPKWDEIKRIENFRFDPVHSAVPNKKFGLKTIRFFKAELPPSKPLAVLIPKLSTSPVIDGALDDNCYKEALEAGDFQLIGNGGIASSNTRVYMGYDDTNLYIGFNTPLQNIEYTADHNARDDGAIWRDDSMEFFLQSEKDSYYQFIINPAKGRFDSQNQISSSGGKQNTRIEWNGTWKVASKIAISKWTGEISIPFTDLKHTPDNSNWKINIIRNDLSTGTGSSSFVPLKGSHKQPDAFRHLLFSGSSAKSPEVFLQSWGDLFLNNNTLSLRVKNNDPHDKYKFGVRLLNQKSGKLSGNKNTSLPVLKNFSEEMVKYDIPSMGKYSVITDVCDDNYCYYFASTQCEVADPLEKLDDAITMLKEAKISKNHQKLLLSRETLLTEVKKVAQLFKQSQRLNVKKYQQLSQKVLMFKRDMRIADMSDKMTKLYNVSNPSYATLSETTMRKVFKQVVGDAPELKAKVSNELNLYAAGNEIEGIQLVLIPLREEIKDVVICASELKNGDAIISSSNIEISRVGYLSTKNYQPKYKSRFSGDWPEPLFPNQAFNIKAGIVQPVWINVQVPSNAKPGDYQGAITIKTKNSELLSLDLNLHVWNFSLPVTPSLRTAISPKYKTVEKYYACQLERDLTDKEVKEIRNNISQMMLKNKMSPSFIYDVNIYEGNKPPFPTASRLKEYHEKGMNAWCAGVLTCLGYSTPGEQVRNYWKDRAAKVKHGIIDTYDAARKNGCADITYVHAFDEVYAHGDVNEKAKILNELVTNWRKEIPELKIECITYVLPELIGVVDIWCPSISMYEKGKEKYMERQKAGDEVWLYTCLGSPEKGTVPSFVLEESALNLRLVPWICKKDNATGFLYYAISSWQNNYPSNGKSFPEKPWNPVSVSGYNGEAVLIYPAKSLTKQPLSSVRFENLRDGIEDYEYLVMLQKLAKKSKNQMLIKKAEKLFNVNDRVLKTFNSFTDSPKILDEERKNIAQLIEQLKQ